MKDKIETWKHAFEGDDNSVRNTINHMAWNFAAYSSVVAAVRDAPTEEGGAPKVNGMVLELLAEGFWSTTMLAIRRLADRGSLHGKKAVCSLGAIIKDVREVRHLVTREVYVSQIAEQPYDYAAVKQRYWEWIQKQPGAAWVPREYHYESSAKRHAEFDYLSGVRADDRSPNDLIREEVFVDLLKRLDSLEGVVEHATIYFAHAGHEASRQGRGLPHWGLSDAKEAFESVCGTAELVGRLFCNSGVGSVLPHALFDQFEYIDRPLLQSSISPLREAWDKFETETGRWHAIEVDDL